MLHNKPQVHVLSETQVIDDTDSYRYRYIVFNTSFTLTEELLYSSEKMLVLIDSGTMKKTQLPVLVQCG